MGLETEHRFLCPGCGASFGWKPQYAGRKIRCKCGQVFVPPDPASAAPVEEPDPYNVEGDAPSAVRATTPPPLRAATVPTSNAPAPDALSSVAALYPGRRARPVAEEADPAREGSNLKDLYIPLALLTLGLGLRVAQLLVANNNRASKWGGDVDTPGDPRKAVLLAVFQMIISGGVLIAGATLAAVILNLNFGSLGKAALKLCAIAVFATGVASWVALFDQGRYSVTGLMVALHIVVIIYWIGFVYLFALEMQETLLAVAIIFLLQAAATCALWRA